MLKSLAIILILVFGAIALFGISNIHHVSMDMGSCAAACLQEFRPISTVALIAVALVFGIIAVFEFLHVPLLALPKPEVAPPTRKKIARWFSLLEHSPTF